MGVGGFFMELCRAKAKDGQGGSGCRLGLRGVGLARFLSDSDDAWFLTLLYFDTHTPNPPALQDLGETYTPTGLMVGPCEIHAWSRQSLENRHLVYLQASTFISSA